MQSERQQLLHQIHAYLGRPNPTVGEQLLDHLAFALMRLVAHRDRQVWRRPRFVQHLEWCEPLSSPQWRTRRDGWKATRYV